MPSSMRTWLRMPPTPAPSSTPGYVADHQDHFDAAAGFYRRAIEANPNSFEAHLALGLLLARQGKTRRSPHRADRRHDPDPGEAGPAMKARAWRALARLDAPGPDGEGNATEASKELLEALKLTPETADDTLLAARPRRGLRPARCG